MKGTRVNKAKGGFRQTEKGRYGRKPWRLGDFEVFPKAALFRGSSL